MITRTFLFLLAVTGMAAAAPLQVALYSDSGALRSILSQSGVQISATPESADVVVIHNANAEAAVIEAAARRGAGIVVIGQGLEQGAWLKPVAGGTWASSSHKFPSLMMLYPLTDAHAITKEASAFDLTDDTVYDLDLDPAITVLGSAFTPKVIGKKRDDRAPERLDRANVYDVQPQMWAYEAADKHRAFVFLQGGETSLQHASVRSLILRGIAWTAKKDNVDEFCTQADLAALRYPAGGPRSANDTVRSFELLPGFTASAIASEPLINKPIAMDWDGSGRLWIAETPEYPNGRRPLTEEAWKETGVLKPNEYDRPATDRISILEDSNGDGMMDKKTVFCTGLELITGFCLHRDGVIVVAQPDISFIHGEGAAQKVERLYTGFTPGDTHFVANHFMSGMDGWIYANTGSGADAVSVSHPEVKAKLSSGIFRFKPDGSAIEQVGSKGGNAFGMDITSDGELYFGQATSGNPVQHVVLPEWILGKAKVGDAGSVESVIAQRKIARTDMPDRVPYMQIDVVGGYSAACASTVYEAGAWPMEWHNTVFCSEPILDVLHAEKLNPQGPTFAGKPLASDHEWLRSKDFWFFPVDVQFGPDGAMYVLDFYNPIVAHSDTRGPKHSRAGASVRPDREHYFGRIYRIQHEQATKLETPDLAKAGVVELCAAFSHPNKRTRFLAQRLLLERTDAATAVPALKTLAETAVSAPARILALWSLQRLGQLQPATLQTALAGSDQGIKKAALLIVEAQGTQSTADVAPSLSNSDPRVRLLALRAMASSPLSNESASKLLAILPNLEDDWSRSAAAAAASSNAGPVLRAALANDAAPANALLDLARSLATTLADHQDSASVASLIVAASKASAAAAPLASTVLEAMGAHIPAKPADASELDSALKLLLASKEVALASGALPFAAAWSNAGELKPVIASKVTELLALANDQAQPEALRGAAVRGLVRARQASPEIMPAIVALLKGKLGDALTADVIGALLGTADDALGGTLIALLPNLSLLGQSALYDGLVSRAAWANAVLDALESKQLPITLLGPARLSKLRLHPEPSVQARALKVIDALGGGTNPAKDQTIAKLQPEIEAKPGDAAKGKMIFTAACATCHKLNGEGKEVGPVLDGIGVHGVHELLVHIIDPSRVVDNEHRTWSIALKNGQFTTGIIARENDRTMTLKLPGGVMQDVKVADIKSRQDTGVSLMPEGFELLGTDALRDVLAYLSGGSSKYRAINLTRSFTTDTGAGLYQSREAKNDTVRPKKYGVATVEGVPFSLPDPSTTPNGSNVIVLQNGEGKSYASSMPQRVEIPVGFAAGNLHFLGGVAGWGGGPDQHKPAMKVTIQHSDGKQQVEELYSGDVFIDYVSGHDVPGSKRVEGLTTHAHVRYFWLPVNDRSPITKVILESYKNGMSPTTLAITADTEAPKARAKFEPPAVEGLPKSGETLPASADAGTIRALLIGGGSSHDFEKFFHQADAATLKAAGGIVSAYTSNVEEAVALLGRADVVVICANHPSFGAAAFQKALNAFADAGKGVVVLHAGTWYNWPVFTGYNKRFVGGGARGHGNGVFTVANQLPAHPVMQGVPASFQIKDEHYHVVLDKDAPVEVLAMTDVEPQSGKAYPSVWVVKESKARIVGCGLGHGAEAHGNAAYQTLLVNAVKWAAGR